jgi:hypothetical protein
VDLGIDDRHRGSSSISLVSSVSQQVVRNDVKRLFVLDASRTRGQFSALLGVYSKLRYGFHSASMARDNQWHNPTKSNLANSCPRAASRRPGQSKSDANGQALAHIFFEDKPPPRSAPKLLSKDEARRIAANIAKLPDLLLGL